MYRHFLQLWMEKQRKSIVWRTCFFVICSCSFLIPQSGDERIAIERRAREVAEERLRRVMQEAEAR